VKVQVGQKRADHRSLRCARFGRPSGQPVEDILLQVLLDQLQHPTVGNVLAHLADQWLVRDALEVGAKIYVEHKDVALSQQPLHLSQGILAAPLVPHGVLANHWQISGNRPGPGLDFAIP